MTFFGLLFKGLILAIFFFLVFMDVTQSEIVKNVPVVDIPVNPKLNPNKSL